MDNAGDQTLGYSGKIKKHSYLSRGNVVPGCRLEGNVNINKVIIDRICVTHALQVKGEFHIAFGKQAEAVEGQGGAGGHIHRFTPEELFTFNCSHIIQELSFGERFPGRVNPLEGVSQIVRKGTYYM